MSSEQKPDWEHIANEMFRALGMCMKNLKAPPGSGGMIGRFQPDGSLQMKHWREEVADALEKYPGVKIDRELYHSLDMTKNSARHFARAGGVDDAYPNFCLQSTHRKHYLDI